MTTAAIILLILMSFFAAFIQRVTGFGYGIVLMTLAPHLMPSYAEATALSGMLATVCALGAGIKLFKIVPWRKLIIILMTFLVVSFFSVRVVAHIDNYVMKKILGGILIFISIYFLFINGKIHIRPTATAQMGMGTVSGLMGGLFGMQGPPAVIYFISCANNKEEYMALTQWYFLLGNIAMTCYRAGSGFLTTEVLKTFTLAVAAVFIGLYAGSYVYKRLPIHLIRKSVFLLLGVAGVIALVS